MTADYFSPNGYSPGYIQNCSNVREAILYELELEKRTIKEQLFLVDNAHKLVKEAGLRIELLLERQMELFKEQFDPRFLNTSPCGVRRSVKDRLRRDRSVKDRLGRVRSVKERLGPRRKIIKFNNLWKRQSEAAFMGMNSTPEFSNKNFNGISLNADNSKKETEKGSTSHVTQYDTEKVSTDKNETNINPFPKTAVINDDHNLKQAVENSEEFKKKIEEKNESAEVAVDDLEHVKKSAHSVDKEITECICNLEQESDDGVNCNNFTPTLNDDEIPPGGAKKLFKERSSCDRKTESPPPKENAENEIITSANVKSDMKNCTACKVIFPTEQLFNQHMQESRHKANIDALRMKQSAFGLVPTELEQYKTKKMWKCLQPECTCCDSKNGNGSSTHNTSGDDLAFKVDGNIEQMMKLSKDLLTTAQTNAASAEIKRQEIAGVTNTSYSEQAMFNGNASKAKRKAESPPTEIGTSKKIPKPAFRCELCNVLSLGESMYNTHIQGKRHKKAQIKAAQRMEQVTQHAI